MPLVVHEGHQGEQVEHDNDEVERVGDFHAARVLRGTDQALLEADELAKGTRVLTARVGRF